MKISYKKLWKLLIDKEINKKQLAELSGISQYTVNKMTHGDNINTETLVKICTALQVDIGDVTSLEDGDIKNVK
ncbi:helix-turn-helix domain-containing protein [Brochothrix thermosphacta]|uniref:helix-turn-helix domain-containing protein n=1 Tax=Brochothrix thermosphacta TaxID=2756 RepID=UPI003F96DD50